MKFKLDENLSPTLAAGFVAVGHEVHSVLEQYPPAHYAGIIVLRLGTQSHGPIATAVDDAIRLLDREQLNGRLWIVEAGRVRIHD